MKTVAGAFSRKVGGEHMRNAAGGLAAEREQATALARITFPDDHVLGGRFTRSPSSRGRTSGRKSSSLQSISQFSSIPRKMNHIDAIGTGPFASSCVAHHDAHRPFIFRIKAPVRSEPGVLKRDTLQGDIGRLLYQHGAYAFGHHSPHYPRRPLPSYSLRISRYLSPADLPLAFTNASPLTATSPAR